MPSKKEYNQIARKAIGKALVIKRKERNLTQVDVVNRLGYSRPTIDSMEKGTAPYLLDQLLDYCRLVGVHLELGMRDETNNNFTMLGEQPPSPN